MSDQINQFINEELGDWSENVLALLMDNIKAKDLVFTQELLNSFQAQVIKATGDTLGGVKLAFNDYGRMKEMKGLFYTKMPPMDLIQNWVQKIGVSNFKYIPGYQSGRIPSESLAIKRIAFGIAKARLDNQGKYKPQKWFAKAFYTQINVLIRRLLDGYQDFTARAITEPLKS